MSLRYVYLLLATACTSLCLASSAIAGDTAPASQLSADEIAIENQAQQEGLSSGGSDQPTGKYYEVGAPKPVVTDRISDTEYSKIQKIVNVDQLTEEPAKDEKPKLTPKQLEQIKLAQLRAEQERKRQELANRRELARKKQVKITFTEPRAKVKTAVRVTAKKAPRKPSVVAKTLPRKRALAVGGSKRAPASVVAKPTYTHQVVDAETRQAARAKTGLQQEIDPNW